MKLEFLGINIRNFMTYTEADLDLTAVGSGLHYVRGRNLREPRLGSNGAGKSSIWKALTWCLYGRSVEGLRNTDVVQWNGSKKARVAVDISCDGKDHRIVRSLSPNRLLLDGKVVSQESIEKLIGLNFDVFCHTVVLGQGQPLFFDLQPAAKIALFTDLLDLDRWDARAARAAKEAAKLDREDAGDRGELSGATEALSRLEAMVRDAEENARLWENDRQKEMDEAKAGLKEWKASLDKLNKHIEKAELDLDGVMVEVKLSDIEKKLAEHAKARESMLKTEAALKANQRERDRLAEQLASFAKGKCPTCGQPVRKGDTHKAEIVEAIAELEAEANGLDVDANVKVVKRLKAECDRISTANKSLTERADKLMAYVDSVLPKVAELKAKIDLGEKALSGRSTERNPHEDHAADLRKQRKKMVARVNELKEVVESRAKELQAISFWSKGFKDIRLFIIEDVLAELELVTNAHLEAMGLVGWETRYAIERETNRGTASLGIDISILSPANDKAVKWRVWSGGEGQRLRLDGALALSEVLLNYAGVDVNFEVLDEPTRHLSKEGVDDLCAFLADRARQLDRQTWYVDHQVVESSRFASVLTVTKDKNGNSTLELD